MKTPPQIETTPVESVTILSISPTPEDHISLHAIVKKSDWSVYGKSKWAIHPMLTLDAALPVVKTHRIPIVVSECDLSPGTWRDLLEELFTLPHPPALIVTSRLADESL